MKYQRAETAHSVPKYASTAPSSGALRSAPFVRLVRTKAAERHHIRRCPIRLAVWQSGPAYSTDFCGPKTGYLGELAQ